MIDLHMHTLYSDGTDNVQELLSNANARNLEIISITDHNSCKAYEEMQEYNYKKHFNGEIIVGCEFTTSFDSRLIEVLGYGFDYKKINKFLYKFYEEESEKKRVKIMIKTITEKIKELGLTFDSDKVWNWNNLKKFDEYKIYDELSSHKENKQILDENIWDSFSDFFRIGLTNPNSKLFVDKAALRPNINDVITHIHNAGGIAFLAHPYIYKFHNTELFLENIYNTCDLDGIECYYTTFSDDQTNYLLNFAKERNLLISGGSDYHGTRRKTYQLGIGSGNLNIDKSIIKKWNVSFYN